MDPRAPVSLTRAVLASLTAYTPVNGCRAAALASPAASAPGSFIVASGFSKYYVMAAPPSGVPEDVNAFELVRADRPVKGFADVEWDPAEHALDVQHTIIEVCRYMADLMGVDAIADNGYSFRRELFEVMQSPGMKNGKAFESYHIVCRGDVRILPRDLPTFGAALAFRLTEVAKIPGAIVDKSVYNVPHLMRMLGQTKPEDTRVFAPFTWKIRMGGTKVDGRIVVTWKDQVCSNDVRDHLISTFGDEPDVRMWTVPEWAADLMRPARPTPAASAYHVYKDTPAFRSLVTKCFSLMSVARADASNDEWVQPGMAAFHVGNEIGDPDAFLPDWIALSRRSTKFEEGVCEKRWPSFGQRNGFNLGNIRNWAKEDNPEGYAEIKRDFGRLMRQEIEAAAELAAQNADDAVPETLAPVVVPEPDVTPAAVTPAAPMLNPFIKQYLGIVATSRIEVPAQYKNIGLILKGIAPTTLPLFLEWSQKGPAFNEDGIRARWDEWGEPHPTKHSLDALKKIAKNDNVETFRAIKADEENRAKRADAHASIASGKVHVACNENEAWPIFLKMIENDVRKSGGRVFVLQNDIWTENEKCVKDALISRCISANIQNVNKNGDLVAYSSKLPNAKHIIEVTMAKMPDSPNFADQLWKSTQGFLCFDDGIWDFRARNFLKYKEAPHVMSTLKIARKFPKRNPAKMAEVYERLIKPWFGDDERCRTALEITARAISGLVEENKAWVLEKGDRDCGKGGKTRMDEQAFGPYVWPVNAKSFMMQRGMGGDAAKGQSWMLDLEYRRMAYSQEVTRDVDDRSIKIDGNLIKQIASGGDMLLARKNRMDEVAFRIQAMLFMNVNDLPQVSPTDAFENVVALNFPHKFVAAPKMAEAPLPFYLLRDDTIKAYAAQPDVIDAYTWLVFDAFKDHALEPSAIVREDTERFIGRSNDDSQVIAKHLVFGGGNDDATAVELKELLRVSGANMSWDKLVDFIEKRGAKADKHILRDGSRTKRGYKYVRILGDGEIEE